MECEESVLAKVTKKGDLSTLANLGSQIELYSWNTAMCDTRTDLEGIMLREISRTEKVENHMRSLMCEL